MTSSADGVHWSAVARVPINTVSNSEDDFIPGLDVDRATSGSTARLALTYHFYPSAACSTSTCQLDVGSVTSNDGGQTWGTPTQLAGPMTLTWLASTTQGYMVGDYISTSFVGSGPATPIVVFALATAPSGSTLHEAMYAATATSGPPPTPDYSLSISPSTQTVTAGNQASYTVTVNPTGGFSSSVSLSVAGLPGDAAATFNPSSTTSTSMITITAGSTTGSYGFTVTGQSGTLSHTVSATLVIQAPATPDYSLSISPSSRTVSPGRSTKFKLTISRTGGFAEAIGLSVSGLPAGASGSWNQNPATNASVLTVTAASTTPAGSYTVTVSGTSTSTHVAHSVTATLRVSAIADQQWTDVESTWRPLAGELRHDD